MPELQFLKIMIIKSCKIEYVSAFFLFKTLFCLYINGSNIISCEVGCLFASLHYVGNMTFFISVKPNYINN